VNDTYGHGVGDEVLVGLSNIIVQTIRSADLAARYGGEEFVVLMPETDAVRCFEAAERLRRAVEGHSFVVTHEASPISKTISIGCATMQADDTPESFLRRADGALYESKNTGRNKVMPVPAGSFELSPSRVTAREELAYSQNASHGASVKLAIPGATAEAPVATAALAPAFAPAEPAPLPSTVPAFVTAQPATVPAAPAPAAPAPAAPAETSLEAMNAPKENMPFIVRFKDSQ
jgi:diguanylate cyclase (GGDEF)-like protein